MHKFVAILEKYKVLPKVPRVVTLIYATIVTLSSGYLYLYSSYAPQVVDKLNLSPSDAALLTIFLSVGSSIGGIPTGLLIDGLGTELAMLIGGSMATMGYLLLRHCYEYSISSMPLLCLATGSTGLASIVGNYAAMKCATTNYPHNKGTACGLVASGFALSALVLSWINGQLFVGNVSGLLKFLALFNGTLVTIGFFFVREMPLEDYSLIEEVTDVEDLQDQSTGNIHNTIEYSDVSDTEEIFALSPNTNSYGSVSTRRQGNNPARIRGDVTEEAIINYGNDSLGSSTSSFGHMLKRANTTLEKLHERYPMSKYYTSKLFWLSYLTLTLLTSIGQTYIFSVGYIIQTQFYNKNYSYSLPQNYYQNLQVSIFSLSNFLGRFLAGSISDYLVIKLKVQRLWVINVSALAFFVVSLILIKLNNLNHLVIVSAMAGSSFGIIFGTFPSIISDYYDPSIYSTIWGTVTTGPFFSNTLLSHYFAANIEKNSSWDDSLKKNVCTKGSLCYSNTFYVTQIFCILALINVLYTINHQKK